MDSSRQHGLGQSHVLGSRMNLSTESARAKLLKYISAKQVEELYPPYPSINPLILPNFSSRLPSQASIPTDLDIANLLEDFPVNNDPESGTGSNNWVISGGRTTSGKPLLANDPHLEAQMPNIWFQVHLQCFPENENCRFNVAGFSMAGIPGVIIGHNQRIAWAFTNIGPDVMDLYIEKLNPGNPDQYEVNGQWMDVQKVKEEVQISDGSS